ncbi:hypothetical protein BGX28_004303 [Mortierella sp. GBA30]|nr:hypothetical protein BGX28_004303 [Mortierella sp. GBA30]
MYPKVPLIATILTLAGVSAAATTPSAQPTVTPSNVPPPVIPLPPFSGTFANQYPTQDKIAPTNTPEALKWIAEVNLTAIPSFPVVPFTAAGDPKTPTAIPADSCDWTETTCINKDLTTCPLGVWGLTYDDGPTQFSPQLYDFLDKTNQKATLFYIGSNVVANWQSARRACGAGHHIAVHTWSHQPSTSLTNEQFIAEVKYTEMAIKELCGFTPTYFRPPYGDIDNRIRGLLWAMGYTSVIWDYDTNDWMMAPGGTRTEAQVDTAFAQWIAAAPTDKTGHITLEHELYQNTVNAAIANLPKIQATWKAMPVSACMNDSHPYREHNITLATMNGAKAGVNLNGNSTTTTTTGSANGPAPTGSSGNSGKSGNNSAASSLGEDIRVVAMMAVTAAVALGQILI